MALKYRNEQVITFLRTAYNSKHHGENVEEISIASSNIEELEHEILNLNLNEKTHFTRNIRSNSTPHQQDASPINHYEQRRRMSSVATIALPNFSIFNQSPLSSSVVSNTSRHSDTEFAVSQNAKSLMRWKEMGLDLGDDSDFEDNYLGNNDWPKLQQRRSRAERQVSEEKRTINIFSKRDIPSLEANSQLSSLLTSSRTDPREQYLEAVAGLKEGQGEKFKIHLLGKPPFMVEVKPSCSTHLAIGYCLLKADIKEGDANLYTLRLTEEDGQVDEDFPALDRVRPVASYHSDEFAIIKATEAEYRENCKRTPNKTSFKKNTSSNNLLLPNKVDALPFPNVTQIAHKVEPPVPQVPTQVNMSNHLERPPLPLQPTRSRNETQRLKAPFASSLSGSKFESILVRVYMYPYDPLLSPVFWSDDMATRQTKMSDVYLQMCRDKMMDPEMFILRTADPTRQQIDLHKELAHFISQPNTGVTPTLRGVNASSSGGGNSGGGASSSALYLDIEVVARRNVHGIAQMALRPRASSKNENVSIASATDTSPNVTLSSSLQPPSASSVLAGSLGTSGSTLKDKSGSPHDILKNSMLEMQQTFGFYKYPVIRLKVLGSSAKELVIDGENIHIMPPSDRSMVDQPKTTSFHIRQVIRIKQSRKTETNFSIAIMKPGGPKTYDLECKTPEIAWEIVDRLQRLKASRSK